jgi:hypothetical protein
VAPLPSSMRYEALRKPLPMAVQHAVLLSLL